MEVSISLLRIPISVMNPSRRLFPDQLYGRGERWGEEVNPLYISRCLASKGELNNGTVSFALGTGGSGISNLKSVAHIKRTH